MTRTTTPADINGFERGLITDQNPLENTPNSSSDELNMNLNRDKSRSRRLGFDLETNSTNIETDVVLQSIGNVGRSMFNWGNAGGDVDKELMVVQVAQHLAIYDLDNTPITSTIIYEETFTSDYLTSFKYAVVDGTLVVATGLDEISIYTYEDGVITKDTKRLLIRDLFGVESLGNGVSLTDSQNFQLRPSDLTDEHLYNLRNSTFTKGYFKANKEVLTDPITSFVSETSPTVYPSNSDNVTQFLFADANDSDNRNIERFFPKDMINLTAESSTTPNGFFIIDAFDRGASREAQEMLLRSNNPSLTHAVTSLPQDKTPGGINIVAEYAGRIWYSGFSSEVIGGDIHSPRMSSYVLFSQTVKSLTDISNCFQKADPTSVIDSALVDTDGGFIKLDGAYDIQFMVSLDSSLVVFAKNGVWSISGADSNVFKPTDFSVNKISSHGVDASKSVVVVDETAFYWGEESIYLLQPDQVSGRYTSKDITTTILKTYFLDIPIEDRKTSSGYFDKYTRKIHWVYTGDLQTGTDSNELIYNVDFGSFTPNKVNIIGNCVPRLIDIVKSQPFSLGTQQVNVTSQGINVLSNGVQVTSPSTTRFSSTTELVYLVVTQISPTLQYSIGRYSDDTFYDFSSLGGIDTPAFLISNYLTGGIGRYNKQTPYLTLFFKQTETEIDFNFNLVGGSSCLLSARWDWTNSSNSNKWGKPRQAYRIRRPFLSGVGPIDNGNQMLRTRNKVRGWGNSLSFNLTSEEGKNLHIFGWGFDLDREETE